MVKSIYTKCGSEILVDDADYPHLSKNKWQISNSGYAGRCVRVNGRFRRLLMHRYILGLEIGDRSVIAEHRNGNKIDNRRENLRPATTSQNMMNRVKKKSRELPKGVFKAKNRYYARIIHLEKEITLGGFNSADLAGMAYDILALKHFGDFAKTNNDASKYSGLNIDQELERLKTLSKESRPCRKLPYTGGACWYKKNQKFGSWIRLKNCKRQHIAMHDTKEEAIKAFENYVAILNPIPE